MTEEPCSHDYENYVRKGRARYHCPKCGADISMEVVLIAETTICSPDECLGTGHCVRCCPDCDALRSDGIDDGSCDRHKQYE